MNNSIKTYVSVAVSATQSTVSAKLQSESLANSWSKLSEGEQAAKLAELMQESCIQYGDYLQSVKDFVEEKRGEISRLGFAVVSYHPEKSAKGLRAVYKLLQNEVKKGRITCDVDSNDEIQFHVDQLASLQKAVSDASSAINKDKIATVQRVAKRLGFELVSIEKKMTLLNPSELAAHKAAKATEKAKVEAVTNQSEAIAASENQHELAASESNKIQKAKAARAKLIDEKMTQAEKVQAVSGQIDHAILAMGLTDASVKSLMLSLCKQYLGSKARTVKGLLKKIA